MGIGLRGDFIGFSFNGIHSSELGITRVSDGSRYNDNLLPTSQDKTAAIPGGDGTYYWETFHTQKQFNIPIAFDDLTEEQYKNLRQIFNTKNLGKLIFDEAPYKYYMAKPTGTPQLKTICFEEEYYDEVDKKNKNCRIYKGEGTIQFTAYYPYAKSVHKWLDEYSDDKYPNKNEWAAASGMLNNASAAEDTTVVYDKTENASVIKLFNPGDMETDFCLDFDIRKEEKYQDESGNPATREIKELKLNSIQLNNNEKFLSFSAFEFSDENINDCYVRINTKTNLIEGLDANKELTGTLYNKFITSGDFFKIPLGESELNLQGATASKIKYDYIYY